VTVVAPAAARTIDPAEQRLRANLPGETGVDVDVR